MSYELEKHESGDKIKWILTLIAFILVGVMFAGIVIYKNYIFSHKFFTHCLISLNQLEPDEVGNTDFTSFKAY